MKIPSNHQISPRPTAAGAFTLAEMMTSMGVFSLVMVAMVATQLFGLRTSTLGTTKLLATAGALKTLDQIRDQIRSAQTLQIGNCTAGGSTFLAIASTNAAQGNALQIFPTTNTLPYVIYYLATNSSNTNYLRQYSVTASTNSVWTLASYITNSIIFDAEDYQGNILTNNPQINRVYRMNLQFHQWEYSAMNNSNQYDNYQLETRVTRRAVN